MTSIIEHAPRVKLRVTASDNHPWEIVGIGYFEQVWGICKGFLMCRQGVREW